MKTKTCFAAAVLAIVVACAPACRFGQCDIGSTSCDGNDVLTCVYGDPSCSDCDPPHVLSRAACPAEKPLCENGAGGAACLVAGTRTDCNARSGPDGAPIRVADFDGDGRADLLLATASGHAVAFANADGSLRVVPAVDNAPADAPFTLAADFDGDGRADLARLGGAAPGFALGNGDGTFRWTPIAAGVVRPIQAADVDGDRASDVVAIDDAGRLVVVLGGPTPRVLAAQTLTCAPSCVRRPAGLARADGAFGVAPAADFDGDGFGDVVLVADGAFVLLFGAKGGVLREGPVQRSVDPPVAAADFDGDGRADLLFARADRVGVARGLGDGTFAAAVDSHTVPYVIGGPVSLDFDGDRRPDVISHTTPYAYVLVVFRGRGDGTFDDPAFVEPVRGVEAVAPLGGPTLALGVHADPNDATSAQHVALFDPPCR